MSETDHGRSEQVGELPPGVLVSVPSPSDQRHGCEQSILGALSQILDADTDLRVFETSPRDEISNPGSFASRKCYRNVRGPRLARMFPSERCFPRIVWVPC
jgi:hypothetical protein